MGLSNKFENHLSKRERLQYSYKLEEARERVSKTQYKPLVDDISGSEYLGVTNERLIYLTGREQVSFDYAEIGSIGDARVHLGFENYSQAIKVQTTAGDIYTFVIPTGFFSSNSKEEINEGVDYVFNEINEVRENRDGSISKLFDIKACSNIDGELLLSEDRKSSIPTGFQYVTFSDSSLQVSGFEISYDEILSVDRLENIEVNAHRVLHSEQLGDYIRIIYDGEEFEETSHIFLQCNVKYPEKILENTIDTNWRYPSTENIGSFFDHINTRIDEGDNNSEKVPIHILNDWAEKNAELRVEEWQEGQSVSGSLTGTATTSGTVSGQSRGYQVGPLTRSKTKANLESESTIDASLSANISDSTFTSEIETIQLYEDGLYIISTIVIDLTYDEIDRLMEHKSGFVLQIDETTYTINEIPRENIREELDFLKKKIENNDADSDSNSEGQNSTQGISDKIRELKELHEDGILTDEEFQSKKEDLLDDF